MHDVRTILCNVCLSALVFSMSGAVLLSASISAAQSATPSPDATRKSELAGLPALAGEWIVVNGENGIASVRDGILRIAPAPRTNLFHAPDDGFVVVNAPMVLFAPEGDFTFKAKVSAQLVDVYDVAALVAYGGDKHWAKLCYENSALQEATVVT